MASRLVSLIKLFCLFLILILISVNYVTGQIQAPPPQEISSGAEAAKLHVKAHNLSIDKPYPQVSSASSIIDAVDFATDGANNSGFLHIPPDPHAAVGLNHVVNVVNTTIEWYTKTGTQEN